MTQIWKFAVNPHATTLIPKGAKILCAAGQGENIYVWAEVDPQAEPESRTFEAFGTGHDIPEGINRQYIGTAFLYADSLVFHVYERLGEGVRA